MSRVSLIIGGVTAELYKGEDITLVTIITRPGSVVDHLVDLVLVEAGRRGCADAGLYRHFRRANLSGVKKFPYLVPFDEPWAIDFVSASISPYLDPAEATEWQAARAAAEAEGTFVWSYPHHCAVGTKPA